MKFVDSFLEFLSHSKVIHLNRDILQRRSGLSGTISRIWAVSGLLGENRFNKNQPSRTTEQKANDFGWHQDKLYVCFHGYLFLFLFWVCLFYSFDFCVTVGLFLCVFVFLFDLDLIVMSFFILVIFLCDCGWHQGGLCGCFHGFLFWICRFLFF